ncbi:DUF4360 domain-containing protein [Saccharothrix violaceirubra]|uniref:DUF4360 domain-containing protein n=1 Tax=Saccharothrix violaceirubra TaxID=413306 RepID=A0A7W7WXK0_9PSEU|nr:DUF4360 domain-containing protein [Saccharothrix violaceirubra]MBB4966708.1 hypothetical protein [Saccharothrix violaceirubra]
MLTTATAALLALSALVPTQDVPDAPPLRVEVASINGSGCPAGTAEVTTTDRTFSVSYQAFYAQAGGGANPVEFRRNCQLSLRVSLPDDYTYGLARTSYDGFAHIQDGATALNRVSFYFQGGPTTTAINRSFPGPFTDEWRTAYRPDPADVVYSPCGGTRNLNINAELRIDIGTADREKPNFVLTEASRGGLRAEFTTKHC